MRSFVRRGRISQLTRHRIDTLSPRLCLPGGALDPSAVFGRRAPLVLEIGCGHGAAAIAYAAAFPAHDLLALDVHTPGLARAMAEAQEAGLDNLRFEQADAVELLRDRVAPSTFCAVHLFFPDPWRKSRHAKRRFVQGANLDLLARVLEPGGHVLVATDQEHYARHVLAEVARHDGFTAREVPRPMWRPMSGFEDKGAAAGHRIHDLRLDRVG